MINFSELGAPVIGVLILTAILLAYYVMIFLENKETLAALSPAKTPRMVLNEVLARRATKEGICGGIDEHCTC